MIIPITAILALVSLVPAIPVDGGIFARSSADGELDARMGEISTALDLRSENPLERPLMDLESRSGVDAGTQTLSSPRFSSQKYAAFQILAYMTGETAQSICSKTNAGPACEGISRDVFFGLEAILIVNAIFNGDIEHGIAHISGLWGLGSSVKNVDSTGLSDAAYNFLLAKLEAGGASDLKRSLPDIEHLNTIRMIQASRLEHDEIEFMDVSSLNRQKRSIDSPDLTHRMMVRGAKLNDLSHDLAIDQLSNGESAISFNLNNTRLDGQSELKKRDSSQFGLKITFSFPGKLPDDRSLITDIAHGFAKHWGQTAFSQTGWSDYAAGLQDSDGNHIVKFRITLSDDKPSSDNADLP